MLLLPDHGSEFSIIIKGSCTSAARAVAAAAAADYEVEFINTFTKLAAMGATFNPEAYLHTETTLQLKF
jgi:hypothetical protein